MQSIRVKQWEPRMSVKVCVCPVTSLTNIHKWTRGKRIVSEQRMVGEVYMYFWNLEKGLYVDIQKYTTYRNGYEHVHKTNMFIIM